MAMEILEAKATLLGGQPFIDKVRLALGAEDLTKLSQSEEVSAADGRITIGTKK